MYIYSLLGGYFVKLEVLKMYTAAPNIYILLAHTECFGSIALLL